MNSKKLTLIPPALQIIPGPPKKLFHCGQPLADLLNKPRLAIVGSRRTSAYGRLVTQRLAGELAGQGVVIISGLALGIDGWAHRACLEAGGQTIAVMPGGLDKIVPSSHQRLAETIIREGGALVSEYPPGSEALKQNFVARNRLVAGLAQAVLITEAGEKSGSLYTARFAAKQDKPILAVPGDINRPTAAGTNNLIKSGAIAVNDYKDILKALGLKPHHSRINKIKPASNEERVIIDLLLAGVYQSEQLLKSSGLNTPDFNRTLTLLEIAGKVRPLGGGNWALT